MQSPSIIIYCPFKSNRLLYTLDWIFNTRLGISYTITHNVDAPVTISYGVLNKNSISIPASGLLNETGIKKQQVAQGVWNGNPTLFAAEGHSLPFDFFAAVFFLLSRYEEYYSFAPDKHGRYPAAESILFQHIEQPIVDEWLEHFRQLLEQFINTPVIANPFSFTPTYDIDIAWSYKNKGFWRNTGGLVNDVLRGRFSKTAYRLSVLSGKTADPYDAFNDIQQWHRQYQLTPVYFVLAALHTTPFDKNISPLHPEMQQLIRLFASEGILGVHPSYEMKTNPAILYEEKTVLEKIAGTAITKSRQHYIRFWFPETCRTLLAAGITEDYSMGYGTHLGFRAGTGMPFYWYDIENDTPTSLLIHPFCFMDSTAHYELGLSAPEAFARLGNMATTLQKTNSRLVTVFHNFSLGSDDEWSGWPEQYSQFLEKMAC